jgi:hypothetical protein
MQPLRLFFDECCSPRLVKKLTELHKAANPGLEIAHLPEYFKKGDADDVWLALLRKKGEWIVVSADRGRKTKGAKLPLVCKTLEITHVLFSSVLVKAGYKDQESAMILAWPTLLKLPSLPLGTPLTLSAKGVISVKGKPIASWCKSKGVSWD